MEPTTGGKSDSGGPYAAATLDQVCLALWGISERLDEHNSQAKRIADHLGAPQAREAVLDEVLAALGPVLSKGYLANAQGAIERLRAGEEKP